MAKYSIIIISKDNRPLLVNCLGKLTAEVSGRAEILVVEAGDGLAALGFDGVKHVKLPAREAGFSSQRNVGVEEAAGDYVVFIDDDVEVLPGWFERILNPVHLDEEVLGCMGAVFPKPTGVISFITGVLGHPGGGFRLHHGSHGSVTPLAQVAACNTVIRKSAILSVGGFDAGLRSGAEDTGLSLKIEAKYGKSRFRYLPGALVWHYSKNELGPLIKWYWRRGLADGELYVLHRAHRAYVLRSAITLKILPVLLLSALAGPVILPLAFLIWYFMQAFRMRFMFEYFKLYDFSWLARVFVYLLAPLIKLTADIVLDIGRARKAVSLWLNV